MEHGGIRSSIMALDGYRARQPIDDMILAFMNMRWHATSIV